MTTKKPKVDWRIICTGMICLTAVEGYALKLGYNGTLLKLFLVIMALAIGVTIDLSKFITLKGGK
jgi:hypothetical protein